MSRGNSGPRDVPNGWLDYRAVGKRLHGTRFIAFKVPLKQSLSRQLESSDVFGPFDLKETLTNQKQELGLIIDLTFTTRYYTVHDVPESMMCVKIFTKGHEVPNDETILTFKRAVRKFLRDNQDNEKLIGVHCTHGLNRTGYLICRYLIDVDGMDPKEAVELFNSSRGHSIERLNYLEDLQQAPKRSNEGIEECVLEPVRGRATHRPTDSDREERHTHRDQEARYHSRPPPPREAPHHRSHYNHHNNHHDHYLHDNGLLPLPLPLSLPPPSLHPSIYHWPPPPPPHHHAAPEYRWRRPQYPDEKNNHTSHHSSRSSRYSPESESRYAESRHSHSDSRYPQSESRYSSQSDSRYRYASVESRRHGDRRPHPPPSPPPPPQYLPRYSPQWSNGPEEEKRHTHSRAHEHAIRSRTYQ